MNIPLGNNHNEDDLDDELENFIMGNCDNQTIIEGDVKTEGGDIVGHDKHIQGDSIGGDKISGNKIINFNQCYLAKVTRTRIILTIDGVFESFSQKDQEHLQRIIAEILNMSEPVTIHKIEPGSIKVTLELPSDKAEELYKLVKSGQLRQYNIVDADLTSTRMSNADLVTYRSVNEASINEFRLTASSEQFTNTPVLNSNISDILHPLNPKSEKEFVTRLKQGYEDARNTLRQDYGTRLYKYLSFSLPSGQNITNFMNEIFLEAERNIVNFDERVTLATFLISLANRKLHDFWRNPERVTELGSPVAFEDLGKENTEFIEALSQVGKEYRELLIMRYHVGLSVDEIANIMGITYKAAATYLARAKIEMKKAMEYESNE